MRFSVCTPARAPEHSGCVTGSSQETFFPIYIPSLMDMDLPALESEGDHISLAELSWAGGGQVATATGKSGFYLFNARREIMVKG